MRSLPLLAALALAGPALAGDLPSAKTPPAPPPPAENNWTGWYGGVQVGLALGSTHYRQPATAYRLNWDNDGVIGGVHFGYAHQIQKFVLGVQAQGDLLSVAGSGSDARTFAPNILTGRSHHDWIASIDGRVGYLARPDILIYALGGYAVAGAQSSIQSNGAEIGSISTSLNGYDVGGGAEYAFDPHWSAKLEYRYYDFEPHNGVLTGGTTRFREDVAFHTARAGLSYHWIADAAAPVVAKY
jgi:opacity protein-like surface antigen